MSRFDCIKVKKLIANLKQIMAVNKEYLCQIDAEIGDGDLGITMSLGFSKALEGISDIDETDVGKLFIKVGMQFAQHVPSTMGTLMASGFMAGGKRLYGKTDISTKGFISFIAGFKEALMLRGKTKPGEKTIVDVFDYTFNAIKDYSGEDLADCLMAAEKGALAGLEATKEMMSVHGKAAVFREKTLGKKDPGAVVGYLFIKAFADAFVEA